MALPDDSEVTILSEDDLDEQPADPGSRDDSLEFVVTSDEDEDEDETTWEWDGHDWRRVA